jgi:NAD+ synthase (glutamine-hydrolysing)
MRLINVASLVVNQIPLDWKGNLSRLVSGLDLAKQNHASVVCCPELAITGYGCEDAFFSFDVQKRALASLEEIASHTHGIFVAVGLPIFYNSELYNAVAALADGKILGFTCKHNLPVEGVHYESRWFKPWPEGKNETITIKNKKYPIGDLAFEIGDIKIGFEICEDAWVANRPGRQLSSLGVDLILNPSASHFAFNKHEVRKRFICEGSRAFGAAYIYTNLLGNEAGRIIYDGASIIASAGEIIAEGARFSFAEHLLTIATIDIEKERLNRAKFAFKAKDSCLDKEISGYKIETHTLLLAHSTEIKNDKKKRAIGNEKHIEFSYAVALGLYDYLRKSKMCGYVVSLSGGIDSSVCACMVRTMLTLSIKELGLEKTKYALSHIKNTSSCKTEKELTSKILTCIYQKTKNSSSHTEDAARELALELGADFLCLPIQNIVDSYQDLIENALSKKLSWTNDDLALQNIQARVRGPSAWFVANLKKALLLATSNRSEAAVGYTTMDGDTCGGLSPIGGVDKAFLQHWVELVASGKILEIGEIKSLRKVSSLPPTAELRPLEMKQEDEKDLMPYAILDTIERFGIRDKLSPSEVLFKLKSEKTNYSDSQLLTWVKKFFTLWCQNQWKRERYAPSFHLDDENLDPKTWCRFPILSSGYKEELEELE